MGVCIQEDQSAPCNERTKTFIYYWLESATKMAWTCLPSDPPMCSPLMNTWGTVERPMYLDNACWIAPPSSAQDITQKKKLLICYHLEHPNIYLSFLLKNIGHHMVSLFMLPKIPDSTTHTYCWTSSQWCYINCCRASRRASQRRGKNSMLNFKGTLQAIGYTAITCVLMCCSFKILQICLLIDKSSNKLSSRTTTRMWYSRRC